MLLLLLACRASLAPVSSKSMEEPMPSDFDSLCPAAGGTAQELALWTFEEGDLGFVQLDGSRLAGHRFFAEEGDTTATRSLLAVESRGAWVVAVGGLANWSVDPEARVLATEIALFDREGVVQWSHREDGVYGYGIFLGDDGTVAWDRGWDGFDGANPHLPGEQFSVDGSHAELPGWPISDPVEGQVPWCDGAECGWSDAFAGGVEDLRTDTGARSQTVAGRLVYIDSAAVRVDRPGESLTIDLPELAGIGPLEVSAPAGQFLVVTGDGDSWRVDVLAGEAARIDPPLPAGWRLFEDADYCAALPPTVDDSGDLLIALRDDARGALWRTDINGSTWAQVGAEVTDALWLDGGGRAGAWLVQAISAAETYCPNLDWSPAPEALTGSSVQIVRGDLAFTIESAGWGLSADPPFSADGQCALIYEGTSRQVVDLTSGDRSVVEGAGGWVLRR